MNVVSPESFNVEQRRFIDSVKDSVGMISLQTDLVFGIKDIHSRHIAATDAYGRLVGLARGADVAGRLDRDMPCEGTAQFADCYVREDQELLRQPGTTQTKLVLNIHEYSHGVDALLFEKYLLKHPATKSTLGTIYTARKFEVSRFISFLPDYLAEFGICCSVAGAGQTLAAGDIKLTAYEHEICFLLAMNWDPTQIAEFMNKHRPISKPRNRDAIYKCRNRICDKFRCRPNNLREILISLGVHRKMPASFFCHLIGSRPL